MLSSIAQTALLLVRQEVNHVVRKRPRAIQLNSNEFTLVAFQLMNNTSSHVVFSE